MHNIIVEISSQPLFFSKSPSYTEYRKTAPFIRTPLTPGSVIFFVPLSRINLYTDAYRLVIQQIGPVCNNGFNPLSLRRNIPTNDFVFSTKFIDSRDIATALETGITIDGVQYKAVPYKDSSFDRDHVRVNLILTSYDSDIEVIVQDLKYSMEQYGKVMQIKQRLHEGFFEGEMSVLLDRSDESSANYSDLYQTLYLESWDSFFPVKFYWIENSNEIIE